jgi:CheY-like chemotaxis protein
VLTKLVSNAVKFTEKGHVLIDMEPEVVGNGTARLRVSVTDTGIGIPADRIGLIFGRLNHADASTTRRNGGTGLGLAISKHLVELMGGNIGVDSEPGQGSVFWFSLPLSLVRQAPGEPPPKANLTGVRLLIVDDNEVNCRILHEQITAWWMRSECCASGADALALLRSAHRSGDPYQIALLDYHMSGMNGEQLGRAIKADPDLRETVLVLLGSVCASGEIAPTDIFAACLLKPVRQSQLHDVLATVWAARAAGRTVTVATGEALLSSRPTDREKRPARHARVLVVDDHSANQKVARMMLEECGCTVDVAANGREAVQMVELLPYDIVFMDCEMPVLDGFEATAEIRRCGGTEGHVPIVALTAHALQGDRERCLQAGMDDYISKPVEAEALERVLDQWARSRPRDQESFRITKTSSESNHGPSVKADQAPAL